MEQLLLKKADLQEAYDGFKANVEKLDKEYKYLEDIITFACRARIEIRTALVKTLTMNVTALARLVRYKAEIMMQHAYRINLQEEAGIGQIEEILKQAKDAINQADRSIKQAGAIAIQAEVLRLKHILIANNIEYDVWEDEQYATFLKN